MTTAKDDQLRLNATFMLLVLKQARNINITPDQLKQMFSAKKIDAGYAIIDESDKKHEAVHTGL